MTQIIYKGIEWRRQVEIADANGAAVDLTGRDLVLQIRRRTSYPVLFELTVGDGITLLTQSGDTLGKANIALPAEDSATLEAAAHVFVVLLDDQVVLAPTKATVRAI